MPGKGRLYELDKDELLESERIAAVGDLHGDIESLSSLLRMVNPSNDKIIFLGDYADRGPNGIEVIGTVHSLMKRYPRNVIALKGNHEDYQCGSPKAFPCDLMDEVIRKTGSALRSGASAIPSCDLMDEDMVRTGYWDRYYKKKLEPFINELYLGAVIHGETLFVHGGISSKIKSLDDLRHPTKNVEEDVMWSDPSDDVGEHPNDERGAGVEFGRRVTYNVCRKLGIKRIIRSHQPSRARDGPLYEHGGKVVTINSTKVYGNVPFVLIADSKNPSDFSPFFPEPETGGR